MAAGAACPWSGRSRWRIEAEGEGAEGRERDAPRVLGTQLGCVLFFRLRIKTSGLYIHMVDAYGQTQVYHGT